MPAKHRSIRNSLVLLTSLIIIFLFLACSFTAQTPESTSSSTASTKKTAVTSSATSSPAPRITPTTADTAKTTAQSATPESLQTLSDYTGPQGLPFDYQAIPLGNPLEVTVNGNKVAININKVITGKEADQIAFAKAPEEMQWIIIQLRINFLEGEKGVRTRLLTPDMFGFVSQGHANILEPYITYTPSPHIDDVEILPGETSLAYLAFQAYRDDKTPLLKFTLDDRDYYFNLSSNPIPIIEPQTDIQITNDIPTQTEAIQIGTEAYTEFYGDVYKIKVEKVLRGFEAWKKIHDVWAINEELEQGKEYIMPYISVQLVSSTHLPTSTFSPDLFSTSSNKENFSRPWGYFCPIPCFQPADLYPAGKVSGWVPLIAYTNDKMPLLSFDQRLFFKLYKENSDLQVKREISPDAISFSNRNNIRSIKTLKQVGPVTSIAFSPQGAIVVTGGDDKLLHIWDIAAGEETATLKGHTGRIAGISFSPDGQYMATISAGSELLVWDTAEWQLLKKFEFSGKGMGIKYLPDGNILSVNNGGIIKIWNLDNDTAVLEKRVPKHINSSCAASTVVSFDSSDDGSTLAASLYCGYSVIWNAETDDVIFSDFNRQTDLPQGDKPTISDISLSPDGSMATFGMVYYPRGDLMLMDIIDVSAKKVVASVNPIDRDLYTSRAAPKNDLYFAGVGNLVYAWWPEAYSWGKDNMINLSGNSSKVTAIEFSNNGEIMATGDYKGNTILWSAK